jgi:hypothetical protein
MFDVPRVLFLFTHQLMQYDGTRWGNKRTLYKANQSNNAASPFAKIAGIFPDTTTGES